MDFEKICMMFQMQEPFYGIILSSMNRVPVSAKQCPTLGVRKSGNTFLLGYNPDFVKGLSVDCTLECLKHEVLHLALHHLSIFDDKGTYVSKEEHMLRNAAMDAEANCYIDKNKLDSHLSAVFPENFGFDRNLGAREYYKLLKDKFSQQQQQQAQNPSMPCNGGQGGSQQKQQNKGGSPQSGNSGGQDIDEDVQQSQGGNSQQQNQQNQQPDIEQSIPKSFDDHSEWPDCDDAESEQIEQIVDELLSFAAEETEKHCGTIPSEMRQRIEKIRKKPRPVTDWRRYFRRHLGNEFSELIRKSKKRESRRFPDAAGNRHQRKSHILVAIDTSGSINMPDYREFFGQIKTLSEKATFHVLECDAVIQHEYDFTGKISEIVHGGGGTSFYPPVDYFNKHRRQYDCLVYFTDGYSEIPDNTPKDTLWVICSDGDKNRKRYTKNGASVVFIQSKQK